MGMDVGVVSIEYLARPESPVYDFLFDLMIDPLVGMASGNEGEAGDWGSSWANNGLYEFSRDVLISRAGNCADRNRTNASGRATLLDWIAQLPWRDETIMLHLGN